MITADMLRECLLYCPETGEFRRLVRCSQSPRGEIGDMVGEKKSNGYVFININGNRHRAHRLAWLYMTGDLPLSQVDHKNNCRSDNRWENLRLADNQQNQANRRIGRNNTSGFKGVYWNKQAGKWGAKINPDGRQIHLGFYSEPAAAHAAYVIAAQRFFGEFARAA